MGELPIRCCKGCEKYFKPTTRRQIYCSRECCVRYHNKQPHEAPSRPKPEPKQKNSVSEKRNKFSIEDIAIAARKEGLTYGQYVAKYGL